jgi:hypothetical protein
MKETPRLHLNGLEIRTYNMAGNCANDKILKVWNAALCYVPLSIVAAFSTEMRV